jgi:competence CoiA-like predicted nuclease
VPFRALLDSDLIVPAHVPDGQRVACLECGGEMRPRDRTGAARHFVHQHDDIPDSCVEAGGESETHAGCTALAVAALARTFPEATVGAEVSFDVSATATSPDLRRADALVEFDEENPYFGRGLGIEVQHRHHSKDVQGTTHDYLRAGFSVAWLTPRDFEDDRLSYAVVEEAFQAVDGEAYSVREYEPWEFETRVEAGLAWELPTTSCWIADEYGPGGHAWMRVPSYAHLQGTSTRPVQAVSAVDGMTAR